MTTVRAFIGSRLDPGATARVAALAGSVRAAAEREGMKASWAREENLHLTFKFLGDVEESRVPEIAQALAPVAARHAVVRGTVAGLGAFPPHGAPRVVFASLAGGEGALAALAADVEAACEALGFAREHRGFHPHVTLARVKYAPRGLTAARLASALPSLDGGSYEIATLTLFKSELRPGGSRYEPLAGFLLGPGAEADGAK